VSADVEQFSSKFTNAFLKQMMDIYNVCLEEIAPYVAIVGCKRPEKVYIKPLLNFDDFIYVYECFLFVFKDFYTQFPLSEFEC